MIFSIQFCVRPFGCWISRLLNLKLQPWMLRVAVKEKDLEATGSEAEQVLPLPQSSGPPKLVLRCYPPAQGDKP